MTQKQKTRQIPVDVIESLNKLERLYPMDLGEEPPEQVEEALKEFIVRYRTFKWRR